MLMGKKIFDMYKISVLLFVLLFASQMCIALLLSGQHYDLTELKYAILNAVYALFHALFYVRSLQCWESWIYS